MTEHCYIIGMSDNDISKKYMNITIPEIERVCFTTPILWEGITPKTLHLYNELHFTTVKSTLGTPYQREFYDVEKCIWYSHYTLWKHLKTHNINAWIFEHDVDLSKIDVLISPDVEICTTRVYGNVACYYLTSRGAATLIEYALKESIEYQVDGFLYSLMLFRESVKNISSVQTIPVRQLDMYGSTKETVIGLQSSYSTYSHQV